MSPEKTIGRYRIVERIGRSGIGVLYRASDPLLDREVAIKAMSTDFDSVENVEEARTKFFREARAAANLQHRNIVTIFEFAEDAGTPYIVMELLRGQTLFTRMLSEPPLSLDQKLDVVSEVCSGLQFAHDNGVVHRDLRPENIWLLEDGTVKVVDFGIAKLLSSTMSRQGDVLGNANYMAPEQVLGGEIDGRADIFSAAVILYELLAGRRPFAADTPTSTLMKVVREQPPPLESIVDGLPAEVIASVVRGLQKRADDRYQSAGEFSADLQLLRIASTAGDTVPDTDLWGDAVPPPSLTQEPESDARRHAKEDGGDKRERTAPRQPRQTVKPRQGAGLRITARSRLARSSRVWLAATVAIILLGSGIACWSRITAARSRTGLPGSASQQVPPGLIVLRHSMMEFR